MTAVKINRTIPFVKPNKDTNHDEIYLGIRNKVYTLFFTSIVIFALISTFGIRIFIKKLAELQHIFSKEISLAINMNQDSIDYKVRLVFNLLFLIYIVTFYIVLAIYEKNGYFIDKSKMKPDSNKRVKNNTISSPE